MSTPPGVLVECARVKADACALSPNKRLPRASTTPQQQLERLRQQVLQGLADDVVGVGHDPAAEAEVAAGILFRRTGGLNNAIETDLFGNDERAHTLLQVRPRRGRQSSVAMSALRAQLEHVRAVRIAMLTTKSETFVERG